MEAGTSDAEHTCCLSHLQAGSATKSKKNDMAWLQEAYLAIENLLENQTGGKWAKTHGGARQVIPAPQWLLAAVVGAVRVAE